MKKALYALGLVLLPSLAWGQAAIIQNGSVALGDVAIFRQSRQAQAASKLLTDTGRGVNPFSILDSQGEGLCTNTAATTGTYHSLCIGHNTSNDPVFTIDGTAYAFNPSNGNVSGPTPTAVGRLPVWNNTSGTLLSANSNYTLTTNVGISRDTFQGIQGTDTGWQAFGNAALVMATHGNQNAIVGSAINDAAASTSIFPTGVTGHCDVKLGSNGNLCFGGYFESNLHAAGIAVTEIDANNYSGAPDPTLPPNQGLGTTTNIAIPLHLGCGGSYACPILLSLSTNGAIPQKGVVGLYTWANAIRDYGVYVDADGVNGPSIASAVFKNVGTGINLILQTAALQTPANKVFDVRTSTGSSAFSISQAGGFTIFHQTAPATPGTAGEFVVYVDVTDNKLKTKSYLGTITTLALP